MIHTTTGPNNIDRMLKSTPALSLSIYVSGNMTLFTNLQQLFYALGRKDQQQINSTAY